VLVIDLSSYVGLEKQDPRKPSAGGEEITTGLKALAKEWNVPIIALSQPSRQAKAATTSALSFGLRESGFDRAGRRRVMFVFREEYYLANKERGPGKRRHLKWRTEMTSCPARRGSHRQSSVTANRNRAGGSSDITRFQRSRQEQDLPERMGTDRASFANATTPYGLKRKLRASPERL